MRAAHNHAAPKPYTVATVEHLAHGAHIGHADAHATIRQPAEGASGSYDGTARVWLWRPEDLIAEACARLPRNLTLEEWQRYIGDEPYRPTCPDLPMPGE